MKEDACISIQGIEKSFHEKKVLDQIRLDILPGEIFGLLGPSGAGKTTMIRIITAQLRADAGKVYVLGTDSERFDKKMYTNFGMALDNTGLYDRLSCFDNLAVFAHIYGLPKTAVQDELEKVGLSDARRTPAGRLSKGMRQRLTLARAFLHNPSILFLDEPTSGLDPSTSIEIRKLISAERKKGKTVFLTTHNMAEASELCDHVALLNEGHIVEYGEPDEICRRYNHRNKIVILTRTGEKRVFRNDAADADRIAELIRSGSVRSIHSTEPTLETVFVELTGRGFDGE